ncbi:MAG: YdcF family protein [Polyangiales bacterium]
MLVDRAFPLLAMLSVDPFASAIRADATSNALAKDRAAKLSTTTVAFTDTEADAAADAIAAVIDLAALAKDMRASGEFALFASLDDAAMFKEAFRDELKAAAAAVASYTPELDATKSAKALDTAKAHDALPFEPTLWLAIATMREAGRDEAIRHLEENAEALAAIPSLDFKAFPFPILLVPGQGPTSLDEPISEASIARADLAADRWTAKLAPLIVLSGGHVHPDRTPYSEAIEMKKYLRDVRKIPATALLVDPHARHTTTNLRDVARLMLHAKIPVDRPSLIVSDIFQSLYMIGNPFAVRCDNELHLRPFRGTLHSLSTTDTCFFASKLALQVDPSDALDP